MQLQKKFITIGILTLSGYLYAADEKAVSNKAAMKGTKVTSTASIPVHVGSHVLAQVRDLRDNLADLTEALIDATDTFGYADAKVQQGNLRKMKERLEAMEEKFESKKELAEDTQWQQFFNKPEFNITVHESLKEMGGMLNSIAQGMQGGSKTTVKMPYRVADNVVDHVQDVRDSVQKLVSAINSSGKNLNFYNWDQDAKKIKIYMDSLQKMEVRLERKEAAADAEWTGWFGGDVYKVTVHESIAELGNVVSSLATSLSGKMEKSSH